MDTHDLTEEVYRGIIIEAERYDHNLTLQFGVLSYDCKDEAEYIVGAKKLIKLLRKATNAEIDDVFFGDPWNRKDLTAALDRISDNINKLKDKKIKGKK